MDGEYIRRGSKLRVMLYFVDRRRAADGTVTEAAIDLLAVTAKSVVITKPDGTEVTDPALQFGDAAAGEAYWDADANVLDQVGPWHAEGHADGYISEPVEWMVNP